MKLEELAKLICANIVGNPQKEILGVCSLDTLRSDCVVFLEKKFDAPRIAEAENKPAAVICAAPDGLDGLDLLICNNPRIAFIDAIKAFHPAPQFEPGVHPSAFAHPESHIDPTAHIGPCAVVERGAIIGPRSAIMACAYVGPDAQLGADCILNPQSAVLRDCILGDRVILHSCAVIGADGFGYVQHEGHHVKIPQIGRVVIEDDVEIGANSAVDRATLGETRICAGAKIDNLVQVAHNCTIGRGAILCGQAGIAGSSEIGDFTVLAGQAGVADHIKIGAKVILGGKAGAISNIPDGKFYSGMPAQPHRETIREYSSLKRLPKIEEELKALRAELESMKNAKS